MHTLNDGQSLVNLQHKAFKATQNHKGFTLVELMIVVAIIGILATIAFPNYTQYVRRGKATEATANLSNLKNRMEQYYQDNRTYADTGGLTAPCAPTSGAKSFTYDCEVQNATNFTLRATGVAAEGMTNFEFKVSEDGSKTSKFDSTASVNCWLTSKGGSC